MTLNENQELFIIVIYSLVFQGLLLVPLVFGYSVESCVHPIASRLILLSRSANTLVSGSSLKLSNSLLILLKFHCNLS